MFRWSNLEPLRATVSLNGDREIAMTNVHVLPTNAGVVAIQRITDELAEAFRSGADLGSRVPHIRRQVTVLHHLVQELRAEADAIARSSNVDDPEIQGLLAQADEMRQLVDRLTAAARQMFL